VSAAVGLFTEAGPSDSVLAETSLIHPERILLLNDEYCQFFQFHTPLYGAKNGGCP
jgi:hypothetical protein